MTREILDVLDRVDWSRMIVTKPHGLIRLEEPNTSTAPWCRCPLEAAFDLPKDGWRKAPVTPDTRVAIQLAADNIADEGEDEVFVVSIRNEMLRRISEKTGPKMPSAHRGDPHA